MKRYGRRLACLAFISLLFTPDSHSQDAHARADQPFVQWTQQHAIRLNAVEAGHGFADMQPLENVVGDARVVALGEATHGTREFFQLKHRMVEFLATQMGFTVFAIEANMPEAYRVNDFVLHGHGDPKQLLKGMYFWTWDTQEVLDMILWMREFNQSGKGHIEFTGFDMQTPTVAMDVVRKFVERYDPPYLETVNRTYRDAARAEESGKSGAAFGVASAAFPVGVAVGKHIKYSGYIRTESITEGFAGLWWRVDGADRQVLAFDNMQDRGVKGTTPWTRYEISLDVPASATNINFGAVHPGNGTAWFDSLQVEIDGVPFTDLTKFDLDFESVSPRGFYTGGNGYEVTLDKAVAYSGKQSLRSKFVSAPPPSKEKAVDNKQLEDACKQVLEHLEAGRAKFLQASNAQDVEWATQNARIVVQYMQSKTHEKTRDESMAENVKWIADQSPGAKLVLWAHNGHVAHAWPGYEPMGKYLRKMFGGKLVNFGFGFNEGSFRAWEMGKSLHEFTVAAAPEGSLDSALAGAGIPIFALDLRQAPREGPVAEWLSQPHASRSIGAVYSDSDSAAYSVDIRAQDTFDAILFVGRTTGSRGN